MRLSVDLTFNGNCREAMEFYQNCLGGSLHLETLGETRIFSEQEAYLSPYVLHAYLKTDQLLLLGSDMIPDSTLLNGNDVRIVLACEQQEEFFRIFEKLSEGATENTGPEKNAHYGMTAALCDRFAKNWLLIHAQKQERPQSPTIEVFQTNVQSYEEAQKLLLEFRKLFPGFRVNFDLEDCDRILRVEGYEVNPESVLQVLRRKGFQGKALN